MSMEVYSTTVFIDNLLFNLLKAQLNIYFLF